MKHIVIDDPQQLPQKLNTRELTEELKESDASAAISAQLGDDGAVEIITVHAETMSIDTAREIVAEHTPTLDDTEEVAANSIPARLSRIEARLAALERAK